MANILIVHAHPEPKSFNRSLADCAADTFTAQGHRVTRSDLYAQGFDPVSGRHNFTTVADPDFFKPQAEERHATQHAGFAPALESEIQKLEACDVLVFCFPLWWFGMPAMLKGWVDRVFAMGRTYGNGRLYEKGIGRGKRALVIMTTGSPASAFGHNGVHASLENILAPIHRGVFGFNGYTPLSPFVTWRAAHLSQEQRSAELERLQVRLKTLLEEPTPTLLKLSDCEETSWADRTPRFLVLVTGQARTPEGSSFSASDLQTLKRLKREGLLLQALLPAPGDGPWQAALELRAQSAREALDAVKRLHSAHNATVSCTLLDPTGDQALSPSWDHV